MLYYFILHTVTLSKIKINILYIMMEDRNKKVQLHIHNSSNSIMHMQCLLISGDRRREKVSVCGTCYVCVCRERRGGRGKERKGIKRRHRERERELNKIKTHKRISVSLDTMCLLRREYEDSTKDFFLSTLALSKAPLTAVLSSIRDIALLNF